MLVCRIELVDTSPKGMNHLSHLSPIQVTHLNLSKADDFRIPLFGTLIRNSLRLSGSEPLSRCDGLVVNSLTSTGWHTPHPHLTWWVVGVWQVFPTALSSGEDLSHLDSSLTLSVHTLHITSSGVGEVDSLFCLISSLSRRSSRTRFRPCDSRNILRNPPLPLAILLFLIVCNWESLPTPESPHPQSKGWQPLAVSKVPWTNSRVTPCHYVPGDVQGTSAFRWLRISKGSVCSTQPTTRGSSASRRYRHLFGCLGSPGLLMPARLLRVRGRWFLSTPYIIHASYPAWEKHVPLPTLYRVGSKQGLEEMVLSTH